MMITSACLRMHSYQQACTGCSGSLARRQRPALTCAVCHPQQLFKLCKCTAAQPWCMLVQRSCLLVKKWCCRSCTSVPLSYLLVKNLLILLMALQIRRYMSAADGSWACASVKPCTNHGHGSCMLPMHCGALALQEYCDVRDFVVVCSRNRPHYFPCTVSKRNTRGLYPTMPHRHVRATE